MSNAFSASEAQKSRDFSERMSSTAYQRAMADMKSAGLNPALAFSHGGASTPSSAVASATSAHAGRSGEGWREIGNFLTSLLGGAFRVATTSMIGEAQMKLRNRALIARMRLLCRATLHICAVTKRGASIIRVAVNNGDSRAYARTYAYINLIYMRTFFTE